MGIIILHHFLYNYNEKIRKPTAKCHCDKNVVWLLMLWWCIEKCIRNSIRVQTLIPWPTLKKKTAEFSEERCLDLPFFTVFSQKWPFKESNHFSMLLVELNELANCDRTSCEGSRRFTFFVLIVSTRTVGVMRTALQLMFWVNGKIGLSVGGARRKSFCCPRLVLGLSSFVLFVVFIMSLCCAVSLSLSPSYVPGLSSSFNIFLRMSLPRPFSNRRLQQRLTKEIRKAKHNSSTCPFHR